MENEFELLSIDYDDEAKGFGQRRLESRMLSKEKLQKGLGSFLSSFSDSLTACQTTLGEFELDEIVVKLDISFSGSVRLIGTAEASTTGGMTLKLKRRKDE